MNSNKRHAFSLSTHQFRARHVQGVQVKKLLYPACTHLRLVHPTNGKLLFRSVDYHYSSNPHWIVNSQHALHSLTDIIIQIWDSDTNKLLIENFVTLSALCHQGDKVLDYDENTVLFQIQDSVFYYKHGRFPDIGPNVVLGEDEIKKPYCTVKSSSSRVSYDTRTVLNLHEMYRSVVDAREACSTLQTHIEQQACRTRDVVVDLQCRIKYLRDRRSKVAGALEKETTVLEKLRDSNVKKGEERSKLRKRLRELSEELTDDLENMDWKIRYVLKSKSRLLNVQQNMLKELGDIFHISQDSSSHLMMIFGLKILAYDQISDKAEEEELAPALGYTAQLVTLMSYIFGIPLRFPMTPALSLSTIRDDITAKLDEKRVLPLFIKGKDKSYFSYGVFLLHRNIAQIRHSCGLKTEEIKEPLGNLQSLICSKLNDTISCQPPARLVSGDKILSKFKTKDTFKKTHKRVRSAPIKFTVSLEGRGGFTSYSNVPSEVSSWSSSHSLKISEANTTSSTEDIAVTGLRESSDLMVFTEYEETGPSSDDFPGDMPRDTLHINPHDSSADISKDEGNDVTVHLMLDNVIAEQDNDISSIKENSSSEGLTEGDLNFDASRDSEYLAHALLSNGKLDCSPDLIAFDTPNDDDTSLNVPRISSRSTSPSCNIPTMDSPNRSLSKSSHKRSSHSPKKSLALSPNRRSSHSPNRSPSQSPNRSPGSHTPRSSTLPSNAQATSDIPKTPARTPSRSSFKSYVRGSNLWGMSEDVSGRTASFKSYHTLPTAGDAVDIDTVQDAGEEVGFDTLQDAGEAVDFDTLQDAGKVVDIGTVPDAAKVVDIEEWVDEWGEEDGSISSTSRHVRSSPVVSGDRSRPVSTVNFSDVLTETEPENTYIETGTSSDMTDVNNKSDITGNKSDTTSNKSDITSNKSNALHKHMPSSDVSTLSTSVPVNSTSRRESERSLSVSVTSGSSLRHYTTKVYMALDSPIIMHSPELTNHAQKHRDHEELHHQNHEQYQKQQYSNQHHLHQNKSVSTNSTRDTFTRGTSPRTVERLSDDIEQSEAMHEVVPDVCPQEIFLN